MEELNIEIEVLESQKEKIQVAITNFTEYGSYPSDLDFSDISKLSDKLKIVNIKLAAFIDLRKVIKFNKSDKSGKGVG